MLFSQTQAIHLWPTFYFYYSNLSLLLHPNPHRHTLLYDIFVIVICLIYSVLFSKPIWKV